MFLSFFKYLSIIMFIFFIFSCSPNKKVSEKSDLDFSIITYAEDTKQIKSLLLNWKREKLLKVCMTLSPTQGAFDRKEIEFLVTKALKEWNNGLLNHKSWQIFEFSIEFFGAVECPIDRDIALVFTADLQEMNQWNARLNMKPQFVPRSYAFPNIGLSVISLHDYTRSCDKECGYAVILHELGHLIGLGDVYIEQDPNKPQTDTILQRHPPAVMSNTFALSKVELQPDDIAGLKAVLDLALGGAVDCGNGYQKYNPPNDVRANRSQYCLPKNTVINDHQGTDIQVNKHELCSDGLPKNSFGNCDRNQASGPLCRQGEIPYVAEKACCPKEFPYFDQQIRLCSNQQINRDPSISTNQGFDQCALQYGPNWYYEASKNACLLKSQSVSLEEFERMRVKQLQQMCQSYGYTLDFNSLQCVSNQFF